MSKYFAKCLIAVVMALPLLASQAVKAAPMLDIVVIMDNSSSLTNVDFSTQKDIVQNLFNTFAIGPTDTRFGIVSYATGVQLTAGLSDNAAQLNSALQNANQIFGQSNHTAAFEMAKGQLDAPNPAYRPDHEVTDIVIMLTDGVSNQGSSPVVEALVAANELKAAGAYVFTLGFGGIIDEQTLRDYSSAPADDFAFVAADFDSGFAEMNHIIDEINRLTAANVDAPTPVSLLLLGLIGLFMLHKKSGIKNSRQWNYAIN